MMAGSRAGWAAFALKAGGIEIGHLLGFEGVSEVLGRVGTPGNLGVVGRDPVGVTHVDGGIWRMNFGESLIAGHLMPGRMSSPVMRRTKA